MSSRQKAARKKPAAINRLVVSITLHNEPDKDARKCRRVGPAEVQGSLGALVYNALMEAIEQHDVRTFVVNATA